MINASTDTSHSVPARSQPDRIKMVAQEFESLFSAMMLKAMRKTVGENSLVPAGMGEKIYTGMLDDEYAKMMGMNGTLGLAELIEKELRSHEGIDVTTEQLKMPAWMIDNRLLPQGGGTVRQSSAGVERLAERVAQWDDLISEASETYGVDRNLVAAVVAQESGGNRFAVSRAGAKGLMQLMDDTARSLGVTSSFDPRQNIDGGVRYLRRMLDRFHGDESLALASYNAGPGAVNKYSGIPPYRETVNYVRSVAVLKQQFAALQTASVDREQQ